MALQNINIALELWGILISLLALIGVGFNSKVDKLQSWLLLGICFISMMTMTAGLVMIIYRTGEGPETGTVLLLSSFFELICTYGFIFLLSLFLFASADKTGENIRWKKFVYFVYGVVMLSAVLMAMSETYMKISLTNEMSRGSLYWLTRIVGIMLIMIDFIYLIALGKKMKKQEQLMFVFYYSIIVLALIIQIYIAEINVFHFAVVLDIMIMFMAMIKANVENYTEQRKLLADMKMNLMLSQMRPHFLYNTLSSIAYFCDEDPKTAKKMTIMFADYLRKNMDDLEKSEDVAFEVELKHVETYLSIERARFGDMLNIEYDIKAKDFKLPTLTLQPIVENAVKHGVCAKEDGGTVNISTFETESEYVITVTDDGVGFDTNASFDGGRRHIGLRNVRERLSSVSRATMDVESRIGEGTKVTIKIPKEEKR